MYILIPLLLLTAPPPVDPQVIHYCNELIEVADEAVERGYINEQEAEDLIQGCLRTK